jgi:hypothetical protein
MGEACHSFTTGESKLT